LRLAISRDLSVVAFPVFYTDVVMLVPSVQAVGMTLGQAQPAFAGLQRVLSIDVATEARVQRGLARLLAGRTSLVIAHRLSTIRGADRLVVLEAGRVVEQGSPAELRAAGGHYAQLEAESERLA
jgi:ATP-binding cassette subfamily B protein